ncbi:MAG: hypothetical protein HY303_19990 [Candidatus Wallbacteria bacterium]|nr:hypothetical protein [Candidatus Wallbacteria bacterium]
MLKAIMRDFGPLRCHFERASDGAPVFMPLHGRGGSSSDICVLGHSLARNAHLIAPDGPLPWPLEGPVTGHAWYTQNQSRRTEELLKSRELLGKCIAAVKRELGDTPLVLLGFSQGAVMTLDTGLREPTPATLLIALSGFLHEDLGGPQSPPTLVAHGTMDDVIPVSAGRSAHERLKKRGVHVTYRETPTDHSIRHPVLAAIKGFLREHDFPPRTSA